MRLCAENTFPSAGEANMDGSYYFTWNRGWGGLFFLSHPMSIPTEQEYSEKGFAHRLRCTSKAARGGGGLMTDGCTARDWENGCSVNVTNFSNIFGRRNNQQSKWDRIRSKQILQKWEFRLRGRKIASLVPRYSSNR